MARDTERVIGIPARDAAIDELASALGLDRIAAAGLVDCLVLASVCEAKHQINEALVEPLQTAVKKNAAAFDGLLERARRELGGERG